MQTPPKRRLETLFHAASSRSAGAERRAYLDGACGDDGDLRLRVEALLVAHDAAAGFLDAPAVSGSHEGPGSLIGPYKLLQEIGEGGMGVVYMAEQEEPVRRKVALKVIKLGMDTKQVIARFEAERQALALMEHEGIARVFDAGSTATGRPYFVMELVRGVPINEYCDTHNLGLNERLELFIHVCRAVQHAHQKGIIHRDLKPTNVLVTSHDGRPVPKIIDFGVAKATNQKLTERTLFTEYHQVIGTPEYMSPEQAEMSGLDVDTRSDIYSLGVLLYKLLTGTTPADPTDLRTAAFAEMTRMIREDEHPAPSTRITKLGVDGVKIAKHRRSDTGSLAKHFRGDLDWIVMKALEKDRTRRYENASAFAEDVSRHLASQPVQAGPPGVSYRLRKFVHRNRAAVMGALTLLLVIGLGLAGTTAGFLKARAEANRAGMMSASLQDVLAMSDPGHAADRSEVERVLADVRQTFGEQHATYAAVLDTLALRLHDAGDFDTAVELGRESIEVWKQVYGDSHSSVGIALTRLGTFLRGQGDEAQAEVSLRAALAIFGDAAGVRGSAASDTRIRLAELLSNRGEYEAADDLLGDALAIMRASKTLPHFRILEALELRVVVQFNRSDADMRIIMREVYDEAHSFYPDHSPVLAYSSMGLGRALFQAGELTLAEPYLREAVERMRSSERPHGAFFVGAADLLFQILRGRVDPSSIRYADDLLRDMIAIARNFWGVETLASTLVFYGRRMQSSERFAEAMAAVMEAHACYAEAERDSLKRESLRDKMANMAFMIMLRPGRGVRAYELAQEAMERALAEEPDKPAMLVVLAGALYRQGEFELAAETLGLLGPLSTYSGGLAKTYFPVDHALRALSHAQLGNRKRAQAEFKAFRAGLRGDQAVREVADITREFQALMDAPRSAQGED